MGRRGRRPMPKVVDHGTAAFGALPRCPAHLNAVARKEWRRLASALHSVGVLTVADRTALAVYCQAYCRWVEAEERLATTPMLLKTATGYVQQSPWLSIANKQLELMGRYMTELGITPASRSRIKTAWGPATQEPLNIVFRTFYEAPDGSRIEHHQPTPPLCAATDDSDTKTGS